jgi:hypothetical protein
MKKAIAPILSALALVFAASAAPAQDQLNGRCGPADIGKQILKDVGEVPTGKTGKAALEVNNMQVPVDVEIYANTATGAWTLVAMLPPQLGPKPLACMVEGGNSGYPKEVEKKPWYHQVFGGGSAPEARAP